MTPQKKQPKGNHHDHPYHHSIRRLPWAYPLAVPVTQTRGKGYLGTKIPIRSHPLS
jgi:hypothetical protein